jgi:glycosidase
VWYSKSKSNYYALFWSEMPDLNFTYKPVKDSIFSAAKFWLDSMDIDGFRLDAAMYLYEN